MGGIFHTQKQFGKSDHKKDACETAILVQFP